MLLSNQVSKNHHLTNVILERTVTLYKIISLAISREALLAILRIVFCCHSSCLGQEKKITKPPQSIVEADSMKCCCEEAVDIEELDFCF